MKRGFQLISLATLSLLLLTIADICSETPNAKSALIIDKTIASFSDVLVLSPVDFPVQQGNIRLLKQTISKVRTTSNPLRIVWGGSHESKIIVFFTDTFLSKNYAQQSSLHESSPRLYLELLKLII